jgi:DNA-binding cell septation regulator SpoVG
MRSLSPTTTLVNTQNPYTQRISVTAIHPTDQAGNVKAFVIIRLGEALEIRGCKIIQQPGQKAWVAMPDRPHTDGKGYTPYVKILDDRLMEAISNAVLEAWRNGGGA